LDGQPAEGVADVVMLEREHRNLVELTGRLSPYAQDQVDIEPADTEFAEHVERLRTMLERVYGQRFTFRGEQREPTGSRVIVRQKLGTVEGAVVGAHADVGAGGELLVDQDAASVKSGGGLTGFTGSIGGIPGGRES
jgi:hypothetical protein